MESRRARAVHKIDNLASLSIKEYTPPNQFKVENAATGPFTTHLKSLRCWMNMDDMTMIESGQSVVIQCNEKIMVGIAWPSDMVERGSCHLSGNMRGQLGVEVEMDVQIRVLDECKVQNAKEFKVTASIEKSKAFRAFCIDCMRYFAGASMVELVFQGSKVIASIECGDRNAVYRVDPFTKIYFCSVRYITLYLCKDRQEKKGPGFASIGGLSIQLEAAQNHIESALLGSARYKAYGLKAPRGVLLYGPSGCGKSLIANAIASEMQVNFVTVNAHDILSTFYGESEQKIFEGAAENAPSIIYIDEIDSICPKRDGGSSVDRRILTTLLTLMDGCDEMNDDRVVVLATTRNPDKMDEALRRPGRFDHEIEISIPGPLERCEVLKVLLKDVKCTISDAEISDLAGNMHGFVGADILAVVREAAMFLLRQVHLTGNKEVCLTTQHLIDGMTRVRPSGMREISLQVPNTRWSDIGGQEEAKQRLREAVEWPIRNPEEFNKFGIKSPKGILLYGPPGCSKTMFAKAIATESGMNFFAIKGPELFSKYVGESEKAVRELFRKARAAAPSIVFFDEIDSIASKRGSSGDGVSVGDRVISQLLTEMDGICAVNGVIVVCATNRPDVLDSALLRPGRLDRMLFIAPPDFIGRKEILKLKLERMCVDSDIDLDLLAERTEGFSGAEVVSVCQEAGFAAMDEDVEIERICMRHFERGLSKITPRITEEMLQFYRDFENRSGLASV